VQRQISKVWKDETEDGNQANVKLDVLPHK
jgi:hypothetical protein